MSNSRQERQAPRDTSQAPRGRLTIFEAIAHFSSAVDAALPMTSQLDAALATAAKSSSADADWLEAMRVVQHQLHAATRYLANVLRNVGGKPGRRRCISVTKRRSRKWGPRLQDVHSSFCALVAHLRRLRGPWVPSEWSLVRLCASDVEVSVEKARFALMAASELPAPDTDFGHDGLWPRRPGHARLLHTGSFPALPFARDHALALIRSGTTPREAVVRCAREHRVDAISLALAVGRVLGASNQSTHGKDNEK